MEKKEDEEAGEDKETNREKGEEAALAEEDKEEPDTEEGNMGEREEKITQEKARTPRAPSQTKIMQIKVTLLDNTLYACGLEVRIFLIHFF